MKRLILPLLIGAAGAVGSVRSAPAQDANAHARVLEELIVTARKKEENVRDIPISMSVMTGDVMKDLGIEDVHELVRHTPNVFFTRNAATSVVFIRGIGTPLPGTSFDPTVSLVLDELSIPQVVYLSEPLFDIERFEILRGPQGTLFGKNTPAGLMNVTTRRPSSELSGTLIARIGELGVHHVEAAVGGPLHLFGDVVQLRVALLDSRGAGDVVNTALDQKEPATEQRGGRLSLALQPTSDLDLLLIGSRTMTRSRSVFEFQQHRMPEESVAFSRSYDPDFEADGRDHQTSMDFPDGLERTTDLVQMNGSYQLGDLGPLHGSEVAFAMGETGFESDVPFDFDRGPGDIASIPSPARLNYDQRSLELRFSSSIAAPFDFGEIQMVLGGLLFDSNVLTDLSVVAGADIDEYLLSPAAYELGTGSPAPAGQGFGDLASAAAAFGSALPPGTSSIAGDGVRLLSDQDKRSTDAFGQLNWMLGPSWSVSAGARFTRETKKAVLGNTCFDVGLLCAAVGAQEFELDLSRTETNVSPKVSLQYDPWDALALFVTMGHGFKSGGFNNVSLVADEIEVEPERTVSWEIGGKGALLESTLSYAATLFTMDVDDLQLVNLEGPVATVRNAASARSRGIEIDFQWLLPWRPLSVRGAGSFTDARFKEFPNAPAPISSSGESQDLSGRRMPFVSKWQLIATPTVELPLELLDLPKVGTKLLADALLAASLSVSYRSDIFLDNDLDPNTLQDGYPFLDGSLRLATMGKALSLTIFANNITNERVFEFVNDTPLFPRAYTVYQEFQRTLSFEVRYDW